MGAGVLLYKHAAIDEFRLRGLGRDMPVIGVVFVIGGLLLAGAPLGTTFFGKSLVEDAAAEHGYDWLPYVLIVSSALTGGAVLRMAARVFLGWGASEHPHPEDGGEDRAQKLEAEEEGAEFTPHERVPLVLMLPPVVLVAAAAVAGLVPGLVPSIEVAAGHFRDSTAYAGHVLTGVHPGYAPVATSHVKTAAWLYALASTAGAVLVAWLGLFGQRHAGRVPRPLASASGTVVHWLRAAHSGHAGDYIAWWTFGVAALGGLILWAMAG
jgi:multicomponent Na+:H+ antiporter subunit D